jgi:hypothetical protein
MEGGAMGWKSIGSAPYTASLRRCQPDRIDAMPSGQRTGPKRFDARAPAAG